MNTIFIIICIIVLMVIGRFALGVKDTYDELKEYDGKYVSCRFKHNNITIKQGIESCTMEDVKYLDKKTLKDM